MSTPEFKLGEETVCPKCGQKGRIGLHVVYAKGYKYTYLAVLHPALYGRKEKKRSVRHCVLRLLSREPAKPAAKPQLSQTTAKPEEAEQLRRRVAELERENEQLRQQLAQVCAENEQLRVALANAFNARIALAREYERMCLKQHFIDKKGGLPPEVRETAKGILSALVSEDWVAVRLDAWQVLERFL